jgi:phosphocarrier protein
MTDSITTTLKIINEKGLHARASAKFVDLVEQFDASVTVEKDGLDTGGDSIMGLLMLAASKGTSIDVTATGAQAQEVIDALTALINDYFGEGQ